MTLRSLTLVSMSALILVGCASSNLDLIPVATGDGAIMPSDAGTAMLQVQVQNQGLTPVESSPVRIVFFLEKVSVKSAIQDGGVLEPGESSKVLEFEIPRDCLEGGCDFQVSVDPENLMQGEERSNNVARGHCQGQIGVRYSHSYGTDQPRVQ